MTYGATFEVEMQTYEQHALPLRMRYYRSKLDRRLLDKGDPFDALVPVYVIFICKEDPFGFGMPLYTFRSTCVERPDVPFDNGAIDVVLNASGDLSQATPEVAALLRYVSTGEVADPFSRRLQDAVNEAYEDEGWVEDMDLIEWDLRDARRAAAKEGREAGLRQGIAEGRALGLEQGRTEGLEQGRTEGLEQGREQGIKQGMQQGAEQGAAAEREKILSLTEAMKKHGASADEIVAALTTNDCNELYRRYGIA